MESLELVTRLRPLQRHRPKHSHFHLLPHDLCVGDLAHISTIDLSYPAQVGSLSQRFVSELHQLTLHILTKMRLNHRRLTADFDSDNMFRLIGYPKTAEGFGNL